MKNRTQDSIPARSNFQVPRGFRSHLSACAAFVFICSLVALPAQARHKKKQDSFLDTIGNRIDAALVKPPVHEETCFAPDEPCDIKLLKFIDSAHSSLEIAIYDITLDELVHHILVKSKQIPVRIVVDAKQSHEARSLVSTLVTAGAQIRFGHQRGIMHNKFTIVDGKMVETGSFNYSNNATHNNHENQIYLQSPTVVKRFQQEFERLWASGDPVQLSSGRARVRAAREKR